jgi:hypothetical protein
MTISIEAKATLFKIVTNEKVRCLINPKFMKIATRAIKKYANSAGVPKVPVNSELYITPLPGS